MQNNDHPLLELLGARVRGLRAQRGLTRRQLAASSGLSERFMAELEAGRANISVLNLAHLAQALGVRPASLIEEAGADRGVIALLGLRGAGKSTVGPGLAQALGVPFFELDRLVEAEMGMSLSEIFSLHGEHYYRRRELAVLRQFLVDHPRAVLATGGGVVTSSDALEVLLARTRTVWLRAQPEEHWDRVMRQGDLRPMQDNPHAMSELRRRLHEREPLYARAELTVSTSGLEVAEVVDAILRELSVERGEPGQ